MKIQPIALFIVFFLFFNSTYAQWVNRYNGQGDFRDQFNAVMTDASGNIFLAGSTENPNTNRDILVVKLNSSGDTVWTSTYNGAGNNADEAQAMAMDGSGNIYITGYEKGALTGFDMVTIKFNSAGVIQWARAYLFVTDESDYGNSIAVDANGNVYVTGQSDSDPSLVTNDDFITIKYNTNGVQQWAVRKNGSGNGIDRPSKIALDASGNAYVTGRSDNGGDDDYLTIKYDGSNGTQLWQQIVDRTHHDRPTDLVVNQTNGNVYVTGRSRNVNYDYVTVCYSSSGTQQWLSVYDNIQDDRATGIALDGTGNLYVTGQSDLDPSVNFNYDIVTVKYNSAGVQQWVKSFAGTTDNDDIPTGIYVDASGSCFVTGSSDTDPGLNISNDYVTLGYNTSGTLLFTQTFNSTGSSNDVPAGITSDVSGNIIVTGSTESIPQRNGATLKYNSSGAVQWTKYYNGLGDNSENTHAIAIDANNNVFIAGYTVEYGMDRNFSLQKIDASGNTQWVKTLDGTSSESTDEAYGVAVDLSGNIFVGGFTKNSGISNDFTVAKYNQNGDTLWTRTYDYPAASESDKAFALALDGNGNVYLTGRSDSDPSINSNDDLLTVKWDANGVFKWAQRYNGTGNGADGARAMKVTSTGNVYVTGKTKGTSDLDYILVKYNSAGAQQWIQIYNGGGNDDASAIAIDNAENIYITGVSDNANGLHTDIVTLKYNSAGVQQWVKRYDGTAGGNDVGQSIAVDANGNVVVVGSTDTDTISLNLNDDAVIIQYDASGNQQWAHSYNGTANGNDVANEVAIDASNNIYVTGEADNSSSNFDYITLKYSSTGNALDTVAYNGTGSSIDIANTLLVNGNDVYVTGNSAGSSTQRDMVTVKYNTQLLGIEQIENHNPLRVYPNPFTDYTFADFSSLTFKNENDSRLQITDLEGRIVREEKILSKIGVLVSRENLGGGMYLLNVFDGTQKVSTNKVIIQ